MKLLIPLSLIIAVALFGCEEEQIVETTTCYVCQQSEYCYTYTNGFTLETQCFEEEAERDAFAIGIELTGGNGTKADNDSTIQKCALESDLFALELWVEDREAVYGFICTEQ